MKTKIILSFAVLFFIALLLSQRAAAQVYTPPDSCLKMHWPDAPNNGYTNPDSVMYDSCTCPDINNTNHCLYAKRYWSFDLPYWALWMPEFPRDTIILKIWQDIDTNYRELRQGFSQMEIKFGKFYIQKVIPDDIDSESIGSRFFSILFDKYQNIEDIINAFDTIPNIELFYYNNRNYQYAGEVINKNIIENYYEIQYETNFIKIIILKEISNKKYYLNIYNYIGIRIQSQSTTCANEIEIDISKYNRGIYFIQINDKIYKFIK
jgi:hypothetical protein